jgi:hypothetical protein
MSEKRRFGSQRARVVLGASAVGLAVAAAGVLGGVSLASEVGKAGFGGEADFG